MMKKLLNYWLKSSVTFWLWSISVIDSEIYASKNYQDVYLKWVMSRYFLSFVFAPIEF